MLAGPPASPATLARNVPGSTSSSPPRIGPPASRHARSPPSRTATSVVTEVTEQPPEARGAAFGGLVVRDHRGAGADAGAAGGGLEVRRLGQRVAAALARRRREVAVDVEEGRARNVRPRARAARPRRARQAGSGSPPPRAPAPRAARAATRTRRAGRLATPAASVRSRAMRAMVLDAAGHAAAARPTCPSRSPAPGQVLLEVARLRRLPHRPARRRRRAHRAEAAARARATRSSRAWSRAGERFATGRARRRPLARLDLRRVPLLPLGPREPLRPRPLHGLRHRRRLRRVRGRRRALLLPDARTATSDLQAAPLLCAGLIGYRTLRLAGDAERLGIYGFGAAAHIVAPGRRATRAGGCSPSRAPDDEAAQAFARELGAEWAGDSLGAAARGARRRAHLRPGRARSSRRRCGRSPRAAGRLRRHPHERHPGVSLRAAVGRAGAALGRQPDPRATPRSSCALAPRVPVRTEVEPFPLEQANEALDRLRAGNLRGAAVLLL